MEFGVVGFCVCAILRVEFGVWNFVLVEFGSYTVDSRVFKVLICYLLITFLPVAFMLWKKLEPRVDKINPNIKRFEN